MCTVASTLFLKCFIFYLHFSVFICFLCHFVLHVVLFWMLSLLLYAFKFCKALWIASLLKCAIQINLLRFLWHVLGQRCNLACLTWVLLENRKLLCIQHRWWWIWMFLGKPKKGWTHQTPVSYQNVFLLFSSMLWWH